MYITKLKFTFVKPILQLLTLKCNFALFKRHNCWPWNVILHCLKDTTEYQEFSLPHLEDTLRSQQTNWLSSSSKIPDKRVRYLTNEPVQSTMLTPMLTAVGYLYSLGHRKAWSGTCDSTRTSGCRARPLKESS